MIATQNPIDQEGTYPLPETQLDRFLFRLSTGYPANQQQENDILPRRIQWQKDDPTEEIEPAIHLDSFPELQSAVETGVYIDQVMVDYITKLVRMTRVHPRVAVGVSPRGSLALLKVLRSMALIHGLDFVAPGDVKMVTQDVLSHRVILNIEDVLEGAKPGEMVEEITVVPRTRSIRRVNQVRGLAHTLMPSEDLAVAGTATTDFIDLRRYQPGYPLRTVDWRASARNSNPANPLLVNQYEPEGRKAVWVFMDGADYMDVGTTLSVMVDSAVEAAGSIAQYHLTRGYTLGAYIYNSPSDILTPEMGQKQLHRLTDLLTQFRPGRSGEDLLQAVEWCKGFLFRLQPEVYAITRLDIYYSRGDLESSYLNGFL